MDIRETLLFLGLISVIWQQRGRTILKLVKLTLIFMGLVGLSGCGSSAVITQPLAPEIVANLSKMNYEIASIEASIPGVPNGVIMSLKGYLMDELSKRGLLASVEESRTHDVKIIITGYNMRSGASRFLFGAMAGSDGIDTKITVLDATTGAIIGKSEVSSYNATAVGGESDVAQALAEEIAKFLAGETETANVKKKSRRR